jgi:hypothetical protein
LTDGTKNSSDDFDLTPLLASIETVATETGTKIADLFRGDNSISSDQIIDIGKGFVVKVINVVKQLAKLVLKSMQKLLKFIKEKGNEKSAVQSALFNLSEERP